MNRVFLKLKQSVTKLSAWGKKSLTADKSGSLVLPAFSNVNAYSWLLLPVFELNWVAAASTLVPLTIVDTGPNSSLCSHIDFCCLQSRCKLYCQQQHAICYSYHFSLGSSLRYTSEDKLSSLDAASPHVVLGRKCKPVMLQEKPKSNTHIHPPALPQETMPNTKPLTCTSAVKNKAQGQRDLIVSLILQNVMTAANRCVGKWHLVY